MVKIKPFMKMILGAIFVLYLCAPSFGSEHEELTALAQNIMKAIEKKDTLRFIELTHKGICFVDDCYKKAQIISLLNNKSSWLYRKLFSGEDSVRSYFERSDQVKIHINQYDEFYGIAYLGEEKAKPIPPVITVHRTKGKWYITNMDIY